MRMFWILRFLLAFLLVVNVFVLFIAIQHLNILLVMIFTLLSWRLFKEAYHFWVQVDAPTLKSYFSQLIEMSNGNI